MNHTWQQSLNSASAHDSFNLIVSLREAWNFAAQFSATGTPITFLTAMAMERNKITATFMIATDGL